MTILYDRQSPTIGTGIRWVASPASLLLAIVAGCAPHRQVAPASIPLPLASALIDDRFSPTRSSPDFRVEQLPPGYPAVLVPTGAKIIGGMTAGEESVAIFADSTRRLAAVMEELFEKNGYTRPQPTPGSGFSSASGPYSYFCGDSGTVSVEPLAGPNRAFARVTYRRMHGSGFCRRGELVRAASELTLPELKPPAGVHVSRTQGSSNGEGVESAAEVTGADLSASTILGHYAAQLVAAGWSAETPAVSQRVAAQYFEAKDGSGGSWEGVLMASGGKTAVTISLTMHRRGTP